MTDDVTPEPPSNDALVRDWTADETGRSNSSERYREIAHEVERIIRGDAHQLIQGRADRTAELLVSYLAHRLGMRPTNG